MLPISLRSIAPTVHGISRDLFRALLVSSAVGMACTFSHAQVVPASPADHVERAPIPGAELYAGERVVRIMAATPRELLTALALTDDVMNCAGPPTSPGVFDVRFTSEQYEAFLETGIRHEVVIEDLQAHLDAWWAENEQIRQQDGDFYEAFRDLAELEARLDQLAAAHPDLATISVIGQSLENRPIRMIRITGPGSSPPVNERPALVFNGTQHSRESLSPMVTMWFIEHLLKGYATDPQVQRLVDELDFHIALMINPDGYTHCWDGTWMWRKNRRDNPGSNCFGVDLNRNWGHAWGQSGSSGDPCNQTFRGAAAFSEPETQALGAVVDDLGAQGRLSLHVDIHSHGAMFLSPWGDTQEPAPDLHGMNYIGSRFREALASHRGMEYVYGPASVILYTAAGIAPDYAYSSYDALGWTIELPGEGFAFYPPPAHIIPVSIETTLGLLEVAEFFLPPVVEGACCLPEAPYDCIVTGPSQCTAAGGFYAGDGTVCEGRSCPDSLIASGAINGTMNMDGAGIFLDLTAQAGTGGAGSDLNVIRFDLPVNAAIGEDVEIEVWTYPGSYVGRDNDPTGWVLHDTAEALSNGPTLATRFDLNVPLWLELDQTTGVYIIATRGGIRYTRLNTQPTWTSDALVMFSDRARTAPWAGTPYSPRTYSGSIHYRPVEECYANCDGSTAEPILTVDDFTCFINSFAEAQSLPHAQQVEHYANCDGSTTAPVLTVDDFTCFINAFALGCP